MFQSRLLYLFLCLYLTTSVKGQFPSLDLVHDNDKIAIPFDYRFGFIIVDTYLEGMVPLRMIFDTGAEETTLFSDLLPKVLQWDLTKKIKILGSDMSTKIPASISRNQLFAFEEGKSFRQDVVVMEESILPFTEMIGEQIDGIIGANFLTGAIFKIDYKSKKIIFYNPYRFEVPNQRKFVRHQIELKNGRPFITTPISIFEKDTVELNMLIDSGAAIHVLVNQNTNEKLKLPEDVSQGYFGNGLGGTLNGYIGKVNYLDFGHVIYDHIDVYFQDMDSLMLKNINVSKRNGIIGNYMLDKHTVIFDYVKGGMYLSIPKKRKLNFRINKSGMSVFAAGEMNDEYLVQHVYKNSPAYEAGIRKGDFIKSMNYIPSHFLTIGGVNRRLTAAEGKRIRVRFKRNKKKYTAVFYLNNKKF